MLSLMYSVFPSQKGNLNVKNYHPLPSLAGPTYTPTYYPPARSLRRNTRHSPPKLGAALARLFKCPAPGGRSQECGRDLATLTVRTMPPVSLLTAKTLP